MSSNAMICAVNRLDEATITVGSEYVSLPKANLKDRRLSKVWRSQVVTAPVNSPVGYRDTTAGRTWLEIDLGQTRVLDVFSLLSHNLTQDATIRVRLSSVADFSTTIYDSGMVPAWPSIGGYGSLPWGVFSWGEIIAPAEASFYSIMSLQIISQVSARYVRLDIVDSSNPDGYVEAGRIWVGPAWKPSQNIQFGWNIGFVDDSTVSYSRSGQAFVDEKSRRRVLEFVLANIPESEMYGNALDFIDRRKGVSGDLLVIPQPNRPDLFINEVIYGRMKNLQPIQHPDYSGRQKQFVVEEII